MTRTTTLWSLLLLSAALALGSCTKDATEQATGPEPEAKAASKLVFSSENAVRGELLVCFGEEAVAGIESSVMQVTRSGGVATRSGIADFDAVLGSIGVKALQRLFPVDERNEERTRAAGLHRWYVVEFDAAADLDKAALDMARIAEVSKVEFNQQRRRQERRARSLDFQSVRLQDRACWSTCWHCRRFQRVHRLFCRRLQYFPARG